MIKIEVLINAHVDAEEVFRQDIKGVDEVGEYRYSLPDAIASAVRNWISIAHGAGWESETEVWVIVPVDERKRKET